MKKALKILSLIMVFALFLSGCAQKTDENDSSQDQVSEKTAQEEPLTLTLEGGDWGYLSPYTHYSRGPGAYKMKLIFDSMLERGEDGLIPWLAKSWDIDDTGTDYTFHLNEGVKWQDGEPLTAEDVKFTFEYYKEHPPVTDDLALGEKDYIKEINVIDDNTINIKIESPNATLLERFGSARILPKHIWESIDDPTKFDTPEAVIGSGPYKLVEFNKEQGAYEFEAFEDYWGPKPAAETVKYVPVSDPILAFENGDIDLVGVTPDILDKYKEDSQYKVIEDPAFWGYRLLFNMEKRPELLEKDLRQAIAHAIDKDELIEKVARGAGKPGSPGYLPVEHQMYNDKLKDYDFDLEKAKSLLKGQEYEFDLLIGDSNPEVRIAELLKLNLAEIGITVNVTSLDTKSRDAAIKSGDYEIVLNGHGGWGNDADLLRKQFTNNAIPGYENSEIEKLAKEQMTAIDEGERKDILFELQEVIADEIAIIPLYNTATFTVYIPEKYDGWKHVFNHHQVSHNKISYLEMD